MHYQVLHQYLFHTLRKASHFIIYILHFLTTQGLRLEIFVSYSTAVIQ